MLRHLAQASDMFPMGGAELQTPVPLPDTTQGIPIDTEKGYGMKVAPPLGRRLWRARATR